MKYMKPKVTGSEEVYKNNLLYSCLLDKVKDKEFFKKYYLNLLIKDGFKNV